MTPLRVIAPCGCLLDVWLNGIGVTEMCGPMRINDPRFRRGQQLFEAIRRKPARAYDLARAGYAMAAQGVGR